MTSPTRPDFRSEDRSWSVGLLVVGSTGRFYAFFEIQLLEKKNGQTVMRKAKNANSEHLTKNLSRKKSFFFCFEQFLSLFSPNLTGKNFDRQTDQIADATRPDLTIKKFFFGVPTRPDIQKRWSVPTLDSNFFKIS